MVSVIAVPELMAEAATDLAAISSTLNAAHMAAATPTVAVIPAAGDEVSSSIAHLFSQHAANYHALAVQAAANVASLQPSTPASFASLIAAFEDQVNNLLNAASNQLVGLLTAYPILVSLIDAVIIIPLTIISFFLLPVVLGFFLLLLAAQFLGLIHLMNFPV
jgi:hypothetical protein